MTIAPPPPALSRHDIILRMYWDGETTPSVEAPIGDFFGQGWDESYPFAALPLAAGPREGRALVSYFPMPFASGARIEVENDSAQKIDAFYYYVDYVELQSLPADLGRFHAFYNHALTEALPYGENEWSVLGPQGKNTTGERNYLIADIEGKGHYVGVNYYVDCPSPMWYGEGDDMFWIDGERRPSLHGTGTEDYFNTSWSPNVLYQHPYFGYARVNGATGWMGRTHVYRFHVADPVLLRALAALLDRARPRQQPDARPLDASPTGTSPSPTSRSRRFPRARRASRSRGSARWRCTCGATRGARPAARAACCGGTRRRRSREAAMSWVKRRNAALGIALLAAGQVFAQDDLAARVKTAHEAASINAATPAGREWLKRNSSVTDKLMIIVLNKCLPDPWRHPHDVHGLRATVARGPRERDRHGARCHAGEVHDDRRAQHAVPRGAAGRLLDPVEHGRRSLAGRPARERRLDRLERRRRVALRASASSAAASPWAWSVRCTCTRRSPGASACAGDEVSSS